jgi:hypothetical protein
MVDTVEGVGRTTAREGVAVAGADWAGAGVIDPATIKPTRNETVATRHTVTSRNRRGITEYYKGARGMGAGPAGVRTERSGP